MKRRYANRVEGEYEQKRIDEPYFKGYVCKTKIKGIDKPLVVNDGIRDICIKNENYEWIGVYPDNANYVITIMFDDNQNLIEWYFDIAKNVGVENNIPFEDDLYLDMVIMPNGRKLVLDEDELLSALDKGEITETDVEMAHQTLKELENKYVDNIEDLVKLTNQFCEIFNSKNKILQEKIKIGKHAIIVIKNRKNEYLQYFDERWNSYLFLNCKMKNKDDIDSIFELLEKTLNISKENIKCSFKGEKTHKKFSESAKVEKEYTHYFYKIDLLTGLDIYDKKEFEMSDIKYKWFSFDELKNDERIQKVNSDIINYVKEFKI